MKKRKAAAGAILLSLLLLAAIALAAGETIPRSVVSGGGGQVTASGITLGSAIGQPAAGQVGSGNLRLCSGYWCGPPPAASSSVYLPMVIR